MCADGVGYTMNRVGAEAEAGGGRRNDRFDGGEGQSGRVYAYATPGCKS
jgi:hypothetical protein